MAHIAPCLTLTGRPCCEKMKCCTWSFVLAYHSMLVL